jgi:hypothetical protein
MPAHGFAYDRRPDFCELPDSFLHQMARNHYRGVDTPSGFSSWIASLHAVLCYAKFMKPHNLHDSHVAVMDTHNLDNEVLVWHSPHLGIGVTNHEYLAFGLITGNRYRAVSLSALEDHCIDSLFPENRGLEMFGDTLRANMFQAPATDIWQADLDAFRVIGLLYGNSAFPVITALACLRPRIWRNWRNADGVDAQWPSPQENIAMFGCDWKMDYAPEGLHEAPWLAVGMIETNGSPDVQQWIDLMTMFAILLSPQATAAITIRAGRCSSEARGNSCRISRTKSNNV